jgi:hypothetical protein
VFRYALSTIMSKEVVIEIYVAYIKNIHLYKLMMSELT